ncbi:hypothetical protein EON77_01550 [bacterium]|nr:MAG: hypothetical protein EON77_01550 [bacterium]
MWRASALLAVLALAGCGATPNGAVTGEAKPRRSVEPKLDASTPLTIERLRRRLKIGDDAALAQEIFPKPPRAYVFNDLPERLAGDFDARGWESKEEGFGAILYSGRVAMAMRQFYAIDSARYDELLQTVADANRRVKRQTIAGDNVEFTFWEFEPQILMVLRRGVRQGTYDMTVALGDASVMDALDMSPSKARALVDRLKTGAGEKGAERSPSSAPKVEAPAPREGNDAANETPEVRVTNG